MQDHPIKTAYGPAFFRLLIFICLAWPLSTLGISDPETARFRHFFIDHGLSNNSASALLQDKKGFIWVGTEDGLNKFNGYTWTVYKHDPQDSSSISFGTITSLYEDNDGLLWIGIDGGGINIFNSLTSSFTHYQHKPDDANSLISDHIKSIMKDQEGLFWISTWKGLNSFNKKTGLFTRYLHQPEDSHSISSNDVKCTFKDARGLIWVGTTNGLNSYDKKTKKFTRYLHEPGTAHSISNSDIMCISADSKDPEILWIGTNGGINAFDKRKSRFTRYSYSSEKKHTAPNNNDIKTIYDDGTGLLWIGTFGGGLNVFDKKEKRFRYYTYSENKYLSLSDNYVQCIIKDTEDILWVGTKGGLNTLNTNGSRFISYKNIPGQLGTLSNNSVWSFCPKNQQHLWIGTKKGINLFDKEKQTFSNPLNNPDIPKITGDQDVKCVYVDSKDILWIGTNNGLYSFNSKTKKLTSHNKEVSNTNIVSVFEDKDGLIWLGTFGGLNSFDRKKNSFSQYKTNTPSSNNVVFCGLQDKDGTLWFGTFGGGLYYFDKKSNNLKQVNNWSGPNKENHYIISLFADSMDNIWIGTYGEGLYCYHKKNRRFSHYTLKDGLPSNVINAIISDRNGHLWLSTNNGLSNFKVPGKEPARFRNYDKKQGLPTIEFNAGAAYKDVSDYLFFGTPAGIISFHPDSIYDNERIPPVFITQFKVFEQDFPLDTNITDKKNITLNYNQNFFSFEFASLSYIAPEDNKYAYKMEGVDTGWVNGNKRHYASYTNLDPGTYIFKVRGSNNTGVWNTKGTSLRITITPPFWKETWFAVLGIISVGLILYFIIRQREKNLEKEKALSEVNKKIAEFKLIALRSQMNPHFIFNALSSIQYFITINNKEAAIDYLSKFAKLIRQILENSISTSILITDEVNFIKSYLEIEALRFENRLDFSIDIDDSIDIHNTEIPSMLIQPFIENSIIHGLMNKNGKGIIKIFLRNQNKFITCVIEDNGVGREAASKIKNSKIIEHKSMGMAVTDDRLQMLNHKMENKVSMEIEDLYDEKGSPNGTRVLINIPIEY